MVIIVSIGLGIIIFNIVYTIIEKILNKRKNDKFIMEHYNNYKEQLRYYEACKNLMNKENGPI